jgi:hypothetical protein
MIATLRRGRPRPATPTPIGGAPRSGPTVDPATVRTTTVRGASRHGGLLVESDRDGLTLKALATWADRVLAAGVTGSTVAMVDVRYRDWAPDELFAEPIITVGVRASGGYETMTNSAGLTVADLRGFVAAARMLPEVAAWSNVLACTSIVCTRLQRARAVVVPTPGEYVPPRMHAAEDVEGADGV